MKLNSWDDFRNVFGGFLSSGYLAYAVRGFFGTGGTTCYVVRVGATSSPATTSILPLPAAVAPQFLTCLTAPVAPNQSQIQLESSDVVSVGDLIAIGDPDLGECLSVSVIDNDQTITVQPPPISAHAVGDSVYAVTGSALQTAVAAGAIDLQVIQSANFNDQDLVLVEGGGVTEIRVIIGKPAGGKIHLSLPLEFAYATGSVVRKYPSAFVLTAYSAGSWGNRIRLEVAPIDPVATHFSLRITVDQGDDAAQPVQEEFYPLLSLDPSDPPSANVFQVIANNSQIVKINTPAGAASSTVSLFLAAGPLASHVAYLQGGSDGTQAASVATSDFQNALDVLGLVDEVAILCCPDAVGPPPQPSVYLPLAPSPAPTPCQQSSAVAAPVLARTQSAPVAPGGWSASAIQQAMITQCAQKQYRVAVLDVPMSAAASASGNETTSMQPTDVLKWLQAQTFDSQSSKFAVVYYPWLQVPDELELIGPNRAVPPCGHVAGAYAWTDNQFGVQKPPANVELSFVSDVDLDVTDQQQGFLNIAGINALRAFPGRGIRVWGARSISQAPWQYIHKRRLLSMIEDSVEKATQWLVFQPNDDDLRRMVTHSLTVFLQAIWLKGGLQGDRPDQGYFVKCDETNNPQASIDAGRLVCQVGVAIAAPMEFLVFEISRSVEGSQIVEA